MKAKNLSSRLGLSTRVTAFVCGLALIVVLFVPLWRIELDAPQYPEGLILKMYPNKLAGNVDIINGLNHYIGMKTLHTEDFVEFTILPYIIVFFALMCLLVAFVLHQSKKWLHLLLISFILFGIVAMVDFWRWEYNYGHHLNPDAAIIVPGMAYQPPLIGYKQLLNFGAFSIPDIGGWIFIATGLLLVLAVLMEFKRNRYKKLNSVTSAIILLLFTGLTSCTVGPQKIRIGKDVCSFCKMSIVDNRFGAEIITKKGKAYIFDDTHCLSGFVKGNTIDDQEIKQTYFVEFNEPHDLIEAGQAFLMKSQKLRSPMGGNIAAFSNQNQLNTAIGDLSGEQVTWEGISR